MTRRPRSRLDACGEALAGIVPPGPALVVTDENVARHHLDRVLDSLRGAAFGPVAVVLPPGEGTKTIASAERLWDRLAEIGADRRTPVVALGGGVVTDLAGFAAATWMRGVPWLAAPTSLLAMVDAAVGGKTGVNREAGKNLVGAFWSPAAVVTDLGTLDTLEGRHLRNGLAEVVKTGLALDADLLAFAEAGAGDLLARDQAALERIVASCVDLKTRVVAADEREAGPRRVLNLGHTAGHAIEAATGFGPVLHGEAVAVGLVAAARMSVTRGLAPADLPDRVAAILAAFGLPASAGDLAAPADPDRVRTHLGADKKRRAGALALVLIEAPGRPVIVEDGDADEVLAAIPGL